MCARQVPGDSTGTWWCRPPRATRSSSTSCAPIWLLSYVFGGRSYQAVVNGVTGTVAGERPWSWIKIALLVLLALIALAVVASNQ